MTLETLVKLELYLYFLKLEGNYLMVRQILLNIKNQSKKSKKNIAKTFSDIKYNAFRET